MTLDRQVDQKKKEEYNFNHYEMWHFLTDGSGLSFTDIKPRPSENVFFIL